MATTITLGNGNDNYEALVDDTWVFGRNGNDRISLSGNRNLLDGGNGIDNLIATGRENTLLGQNGEDILSASYFGFREEGEDGSSGPAANNILDGGRGSDTFFSEGIYGFDVSGTGSEITGGSGQDRFHLRQSSDLLIRNADETDDTVEEGHIIEGVFDVITDYQAGELIDIGTTLQQSGPVDINPTGGIDHQHVLPEEGSYAFIHGDFTAAGQFLVNDEGEDLLLVYDYDPPEGELGEPGEAFFEYSGAVVLEGISDEAAVNIGLFTLLV